MTTPKLQCEAVKTAISSGNATASTVTTLQSLLSSEAKSTATTKAATTQPKKTVATKKTTATKTTGAKLSRNGEPIGVHQDDVRSLTPKERYTLATEIVNITLKHLTESLKSRTKQPSKSNVTIDGHQTVPTTPRKLSRTPSSASRSALQPRSGNSTPVTATPSKPKTSPKKASKDAAASTTGPSAHIAAVGECSRLGFSFLRSANTKQLGVKDLPAFQLENGMLALSGKLLAHGLDSSAIKELRIVKGRLEAVGKAKLSSLQEKETLATLLHIKIDVNKCPTVLPLAITYQSLVLRVIASSSKSATIEACAGFLELAEPTSPANLIRIQGEQSGDKDKTGRLLEALSSTVLGLCPSLSSKADQLANNREVSPAPEAVLRLQSIGLQIRQQWWALVQHQPSLEKELLDPASRCISAFIRRTRKRRSIQQIYAAASQFFQDAVPDCEKSDSKALLAMRRTLSSLAEETGQSTEVQKWSAALNKQSEGLESNHAQRISALVRRLSTLDKKAASLALPELINVLKDSISGSPSDYECLLDDLSRLLTKLPADCGKEDDLQQLGSLSAAFALRFIRSYPGKLLPTAQTIIYQAFRHSASPDAAISWINNDAVQVLVDTGALQTVSQEAASRPLQEAWSSSTAAITLGRALRLLVVRALKAGSGINTSTVFDNENLSHLERGVMLKWQLNTAMEYAARSRYHAALRILIPELLHKLDHVYPSSEHPLRLANLAVQVLRLNEEIPNVVPRQVMEKWNETQLDTAKLFQDSGLGSYADDVSLALRLAKIFHAGHPSLQNVGPLLLAWQRLLDEVTKPSMLKDRIFDPAALRLSLRSLAAFFGALGEETYYLSTVAIIVKLDSLQDDDIAELVDTSVQNARQWLSLGCSEKAGAVFAHSEKHLSSSEVSILTKISWHLAYAEYLLAIDNLDKCKVSLEAAQALRKELSPKEISRDQRAAFERAHGEGWLLQSKYCLASGAPYEALAAAKHAMKIVNSTWCRLEKGGTNNASRSEEDTTPTPETSEGAITELATGVSKLQLIPKATSTPEEAEVPEIKGAAFWPLVPLLCKALKHLSDLYAHHGLFSEANYYSGKAIDIAESMGSSVLLSRTRSHRALLLVLAGKVEDAELCLVGSESTDLSSSPFAAVERLQAQAAIRAKDGAPDEAAKLYDEAGQLVSDMQSDDWLSKISRFGDDQSGKSAPAKPVQPVPAVKGARPASRTRKAATKTVPAVPKPSARAAKVVCVDKTFYMLQKLRAEILLQRTLLPLDPSTDKEEILLALAPLQSTINGTLKQRRVQYRQLLEKATVILQTDFAYNILLDSTLSIPALLRPAASITGTRSASPTKKAVPAKANTRTGQRKTAAKPDFKSVLQEARSCLLAGHSSVSQHCTSAEVHNQASNLLDASVFCASVDATATGAGLHSLQTGLTMDFPRINALNLEQSAALTDANHELRTTPFEWPTMASAQNDTPQLSAADFQEQYINTIPRPWTAVSLALDESCTSLYVARYRADQTPFIVRLPFSRHQDEELGDEAFDYAAGKEELQDIIQLSNTSCHNNGDLSAKGAKSNWWSEREALDRRLQELLINMEDMWFGGFKGVFSPAARHPELLVRFRVALEASLDRHLPSRQVMKGRGEKLALDHNVLELFVNLGSDCGGTVDLDEAISDLLYFVVDMLQFNGERNAYDEIDFDEITVEVLDALRSFHEAIEAGQDDKQHVVLILDKRLQAFPWENLPCLEQASVSRVGSMLSLRDCIAAMHNQRNADGCHMVSRKSGAFILNPSSDLASTQSTLQPALSKAAAVEGGNWQSIVNRAPSEEDFKSTLENSALTLYFGHGAGSQYIRPRTIKKLEKCSEVVWLMGCSSGAVTEYGELEPQAVPLAYLNAGMKRASPPSDEALTQGSKCLAIVATLWDVTDKDIDRFSLTIGEEWGLWSPPAEPVKAPSKTPKKRERLVVAPSTPQKAPKTPKTPRVAKTPAAAKTPARNRSRSAAGDRRVPTSLAEAVAKSRDACYLRYLNGAAPVVYGVPVYLGE
jgi:separase